MDIIKTCCLSLWRISIPPMVAVNATGAMAVVASFCSLIVLSNSPNISTSNQVVGLNILHTCFHMGGGEYALINHLFQIAGESNQIDPFG